MVLDTSTSRGLTVYDLITKKRACEQSALTRQSYEAQRKAHGSWSAIEAGRVQALASRQFDHVRILCWHGRWRWSRVHWRERREHVTRPRLILLMLLLVLAHLGRDVHTVLWARSIPVNPSG